MMLCMQLSFCNKELSKSKVAYQQNPHRNIKDLKHSSRWPVVFFYLYLEMIIAILVINLFQSVMALKKHKKKVHGDSQRVR